tara:strand:- start:111 stop:323 length:213 start_codon:yes stop_codon:yes gene_type:complete
MAKKFKTIFDSLTKNKKIVPADAYMSNKLKLPESLQKEVNIFEKTLSDKIRKKFEAKVKEDAKNKKNNKK